MKYTNKGFSLVELLVAMAISGIVLASIFEVFNNSQQNYVVQDEVAEMQQNVRVAKMFLERDVRMAGSGVINIAIGEVPIVPVVFTNGGSTGTDEIILRYSKGLNEDGTGSCGADPAGILPSCDTYPQLTLSDKMPASSSEAEVTEDLGVFPFNLWSGDGCYCSGDSYGTPKYGMPIIITAPTGESDIVILTGTQANIKIQNSKFDYTGNLLPKQVYENKVLNEYPPGSTISFLGSSYNAANFQELRYYISNDLVTGTPCLYRDTLTNSKELIAENIEDLQCAFWRDSDDANGNGEPDVGEWDAATNITTDESSSLRFARITILARTAHEQRNFTGNRPSVEDHVAGAEDGYRRRQLSFTVKVRNFGLQ